MMAFDLSFLRCFLLFCFVQQILADCSRYEVPHTVNGKVTCCKPFFNCAADHYIQTCRLNGTSDRCVPCPPGHINKHITSSLDEERHVCFQKTPNHDQCPIEDSFPIEDTRFCSIAAMYCQCNTTLCYYGDPCNYCTKSSKECAVNEQMNPATGVCEPCKMFTKSPHGCGPCLYDEAAWRLAEEKRTSDIRPAIPDDVIADIPTTTVSRTTKVSNSVETKETTVHNTTEAAMTPTEEGSSMNTTVVIVVVVLIVLVLAGLVTACVLYSWRQAESGRDSTFVVFYQRLFNRQRNVDSPVSESGNELPTLETTETTELVSETLTKNGTASHANGKATAFIRPMKPPGAEGTDMQVLKEEAGDLRVDMETTPKS